MWPFKKRKSEEEIRNDILAELEARQKAEEEERKRIQEEAEREAKEKFEAEEAARKEAEQKLKESEEPWVEVRSIVEDPKHGAKVELDWNDAFIEYLKKNGITGVDEEAIIQKYITMLLRDMTESMSEDQTNEFE